MDAQVTVLPVNWIDGRTAALPVSAAAGFTVGKLGRMRNSLIFAAVGIVIAANVWVLLSAQRNRSGIPGGSVELTEGELQLQPIGGESTALFLRLNWDVLTSQPHRHGWVPWLDGSWQGKSAVGQS